MTPFVDPALLPVIFGALMALSVLLYVVLDGFDLGVGILLPGAANEAERDSMIDSIGPFWDANETWLVLGVGLLLVAFPAAHGIVLTQLYLAVAVMLAGLTLRGVAFKFRTKAANAAGKRRWNAAFTAGSLLAALSQGWMLGRYLLGFDEHWHAWAFAAMAAIGLAIAYAFLASAWLIWRSEGDLQRRAVRWCRATLPPVALGIVMVSLATPFVSERIFDRWFTLPYMVLLMPLPLGTLVLVVVLAAVLRHLPLPNDALRLLPFGCAVGLFVLSFAGLAWSFFPYVVPERLTLWQAASAPESLSLILLGAMFVLPMILLYTVIVWRIFSGKTRELHYD
jgi:cytochrome bd ubiquinol oxidase subunit II